MPGRPNMSIGPLVPDGPQRTQGFLDYFFADGTDESWVADFLALDTQVGVEDRVLVESVQSGMRSGAFEKGRLLPSEELIGEFQSWVARNLNGAGRLKARAGSVCRAPGLRCVRRGAGTPVRAVTPPVGRPPSRLRSAECRIMHL